MKEKKQNEEIQSRREFFKQAAKKALPVIGAIALASSPIALQAHNVDMGYCSHCSDDCTNGCSNGCSRSCRTDCQINCKGVSSTVVGSCKSCENYCGGGCQNSCSHRCDGSCSGSSYKVL